MARVLIAEDDARARELLARICEFRGHEVHEVPDGLRALEALERLEPDLLITDLAMPLATGQHLVRELREKPGGADLPVIVVTGYEAALSEEERADLEPCTILSKPIDLNPMLAAIDAALPQA